MRDGTLRADGANYTATFDRDGVVFTPALGRRAARAFPLRLQTESVRREGAAAALVPAAAEPRAEGECVRYARTPDVLEAWRVGPAGIELTYTIARPLPGSGDLVVCLRVATDLAPATGAGGADGLRLEAGGLGGVSIGSVTGVDGAGRRAPGSLRLIGDCLELRLPAKFVDVADHPLVLDPLVGPDFALGSGADDAEPDVAYDATSQTYLAVWQREFALDQVDVLGQRLDAQGNPIGALLVIRNLASGLVRQPVVASVRMRSRFVVAWREAPDVFSPSQVVCRCVDPNGSISSIAIVPGATLFPSTPGPRLSGNATTTDDGALLVYTDTSDLVAVRLAVPAGAGPPAVAGSALVRSGPIGSVVVPRSCGVGRRWLVVWNEGGFINSSFARALNLNAMPLGSTLTVAGTTLFTPAVDGDGTNFVLVDIASFDVRCQMLAWNGSTIVHQGSETRLTADADVEVEPAVACLGRKVLVTWSDDGGVPFANDIQGVALEPFTCLPCSRQFTIQRAGRYDFQPAIGAQYASGDPGDQALICFGSAALTSPFASEVVAQRFDAFGRSAVFQSHGGGCGSTFTLGTNGPVAVGNGSLVLFLDGVQGASTGFLNLNVPGAAVLPCGACRVTAPAILLAARVGGNVAAVSLGLRCDPSLIGATLESQWWVVGQTQSPCPLVPNLAFSDRYHVTIDG